MSGVISGLLGGAIAVAITAYVAKSVGRATTPGVLKYGAVMWLLATLWLALALLPVAATVLAGHDREFWAKAALLAGFGLGSAYFFAEAALVRGRFDAEGIEFSTPWTGEKREKWSNLISVEFNGWCSWYVLTFKSGSKIRLSQYLGGHLSALKAAGASSES